MTPRERYPGSGAGANGTEREQEQPMDAGHGATRCADIVLERNRYFTGKFMAARDFRDEQDYFLSRHRLHNRLLHGWGIVCGLTVDRHWDERCADRQVIVKKGIAIDCCGRELVLTKDTVVEVWPAAEEGTGDESTAEQREPQRKQGYEPPPPVRRYLLFIKYCEKPIECVPALYDDSCGCGRGQAREEANRIREDACLEAMPLEDAEEGCWPRGGNGGGYAGAPSPPYDDCSRDEGHEAGCLDPQCPCGGRVPLAVVHAREDAGTITEADIDLSGRRMLRTPPEYLTHIVGINWPHGGSVSLAALREQAGELRITFDRRILPSDGEMTGVNEHTFIVQFGGVQRSLEFLPSTPETPALQDEHVAVFKIEPGKLDPGDRGGNIAGNVVYVTLKCDFVLDCRENPVDGAHLGGRLPTGDGVRGGVFESWFRVTYE